MYTCNYIDPRVYINICMYTCTEIIVAYMLPYILCIETLIRPVCRCTTIYLSIYLSNIYIYIYICINIYIYRYFFIYVCTCICIYAYLHTHTHILYTLTHLLFKYMDLMKPSRKIKQSQVGLQSTLAKEPL